MESCRYMKPKIMTKRKSKKVNSIPKWKQGQVKTRRKSVNAKKSCFSLRALRIPTLSGTVRILLVCALLAAAVRYAGVPFVRSIAAHPVFNIRHVVVEGAQYLDSEKIIEKAGVELGANIHEIDVEAISETLEKTFAAEDFTVFRRLPNTMVISIRERRPVALLNMKTLVGVDENGVPLPHIGADMVESLPIITGIKTVSSLSDSTVKERLLKGLSMLGHIYEGAPSVYNRISEVDVSNMAKMGICLVDNGLEVIIGDSDWAKKIPVLDKVINEVTKRDEAVKAIDIRFGEKIYVRK